MTQDASKSLHSHAEIIVKQQYLIDAIGDDQYAVLESLA